MFRDSLPARRTSAATAACGGDADSPPTLHKKRLGCGIECVQDMQHAFFEFLAGAEC